MPGETGVLGQRFGTRLVPWLVHSDNLASVAPFRRRECPSQGFGSLLSRFFELVSVGFQKKNQPTQKSYLNMTPPCGGLLEGQDLGFPLKQLDVALMFFFSIAFFLGGGVTPFWLVFQEKTQRTTS